MTLWDIKAAFVDPYPGGPRIGLYHWLEELVQAVLRVGFPCEFWLDGSFLTEKPEPDDLDVTLMVEPDVAAAFTVEQSALVDQISERRFADCVDSFVFVRRRRGDPHFGDEALDPANSWGEQYGLECSEQWLKGFVVLKLRETDVGLRICR